jgi:Macrocin-O-methyltransferase (TylF)
MKEPLQLNHHPLIQDAELANYITKNNLWQTNVNQNLLASTTDMMNHIWVDAHGLKRIIENDVISPDNTSGEGKVISIIDLPVKDWHLLCQDVDVSENTDKTVSIFVKLVENEGTKDFTIWSLGGVQIAVFSRQDWSLISGIATHTNVEFCSHGWVRLSATYNVNNKNIYFGTSEGKNSQYLGENKKQFYLYGPQLENYAPVTIYKPNKQQKNKLFPAHFTGKQVLKALDLSRNKYPDKKVIILSDGYADISPFTYFDCSRESVESMEQYDFNNTVFVYACDADDIGLPFISKIVAAKGLFLALGVANPSLYINFNDQARRMLEDEYIAQLNEGFAKWDFGPHDFINIIQAIDITSDLPGDYVEIGCYRGSSSRVAVRYMSEKGLKRNCYFFDVFDGFNYQAAKTSADVVWEGSHKTEGIQQVKERISKYHNHQKGLSIFVEKNNIIEDELPITISQIVIANVDVDLYEAVKASLFKVCHKIVRGGIIIVEDPGHTPFLIGARLALKEFMESESGRSFMPIYMESGQTFLIKLN